jgi:ubiquinone/menaquinone biosynthesis C-methylase UbiE
MAKSGYDLIAREYYDAGHVTSRNFDEITKDALSQEKVIFVDGLVLECGAGKGRATEYLKLNSNQIVQLDASLKMLELEEREQCLIQLNADACRIPMPSQQFVGVVGFLVDPFLGLDFLSEAYRMLKDGGKLLLTSPSEEWGSALRKKLNLDEMTTRFKILGTEDTVVLPSILHSKVKIEEMLKHVGFNNVLVKGHCLSENVKNTSPDITCVLNELNIDKNELPIIYTIRATR